MGYDLYCIDKDYLYELLIFSKKHNLKLYQVTQQNNLIYFYIPIYQRYILLKMELSISKVKSIGVFAYFLLLFTKRKSCIFIFAIFISFFYFTNIIMDVRIIGQNQIINEKLLHDLKDYNIFMFSYKKSFEQLNDIMLSIKQRYMNDIEYLNLYQQGGVFFAEYITQEKENIVKDEYVNLYASTDGMISSIDVDSGVVKIKINDYVKKGDLLVENYVLSTQNQLSIIPVKAKIYAYTFHQYTASKKTKEKDNSEIFYELLLSIRSKIRVGSKIDKEKVLQIDRSHSTITLKMHYTLIEDIAIEGDNREKNH